MNEKIQELLADLSKRVNEAILNKEFKVLQRERHTIKIKACGEVVYIWNENTSEDTYLYKVFLCDQNTLYTTTKKFKKPSICRKLLRTETEEEKLDKKNDIRKQIAALEKELS